MLQLRQSLSLQQRLTPQQVQYLKLLQLPVLALEQRIKSELEENPMLEEASEEEEREERENEETALDGVELSDDRPVLEPVGETIESPAGALETRSIERAQTEHARELEERIERDERVEPSNH